MLSHSIPLRSLSILSSHVRLGLPSGISFRLPLQIPACISLPNPTRDNGAAQLIFFDLINRRIFWEECRTRSYPLPSFLQSPVFPPYEARISCSSILKHPQPTSLPHCKRPGCTPKKQQAILHFCLF